MVVNAALLIKLKESPFFGKRGSNEVCLSANWGCTPHQKISLASPLTRCLLSFLAHLVMECFPLLCERIETLLANRAFFLSVGVKLEFKRFLESYERTECRWFEANLCLG